MSCEIFSVKEEAQRTFTTMSIKAEGRQRFYIVDRKVQLDGQVSIFLFTNFLEDEVLVLIFFIRFILYLDPPSHPRQYISPSKCAFLPLVHPSACLPACLPVFLSATSFYQKGSIV